MERILIGTTSADKLREILQILNGLPVSLLKPRDHGNLPAVEEDGLTFRDNACKKALTMARHFHMPVMAEDSGLEVDSLGGRPGAYSKRYSGPEGTDEENNLKLLAELEGTPAELRTARYRCVVALANPDEVMTIADGVCEGRIAEALAGTGGFGYDPLFFYPPFGKTFGQVDARLKNQVSHRAKALRLFRERLAELLKTQSQSPSPE
ncbi:RdgB/HAM1 family non-canonical purine NTP pyrophosphatase [bacterium]|nr:MAG: RdgB/HAM1 family non-canonical purine NTP pyrophosphatase [bacterium]